MPCFGADAGSSGGGTKKRKRARKASSSKTKTKQSSATTRRKSSKSSNKSNKSSERKESRRKASVGATGAKGPKTRYLTGKLYWGDAAKYKIHWDEKVGEGAYGEVYKATDKKTGRIVVVKTIKKDKEVTAKINSEVNMLRLLKSGPNVVQLLDVVRDTKLDLKMLVFEYVDSPPYKETFAVMEDEDVRFYMYNVLRTLAYIHSRNVIHRDLKGGNVLFDVRHYELRLIDWGFACFHLENRPQEDFPGTRYYKAPELLLRVASYDYAVDMWAFGAVLGGIIFQRVHLLKAAHNDDRFQMEAIAELMGTDGYAAYLDKYDPPMARYFPMRHFEKRCPRERVDWEALVTRKNEHLVSSEAFSLLDLTLQWDPEERITAKDALQHPYFDPVRGSDSGQAWSSTNGELYSRMKSDDAELRSRRRKASASSFEREPRRDSKRSHGKDRRRDASYGSCAPDSDGSLRRGKTSRESREESAGRERGRGRDRGRDRKDSGRSRERARDRERSSEKVSRGKDGGGSGKKKKAATKGKRRTEESVTSNDSRKRHRSSQDTRSNDGQRARRRKGDTEEENARGGGRRNRSSQSVERSKERGRSAKRSKKDNRGRTSRESREERKGSRGKDKRSTTGRKKSRASDSEERGSSTQPATTSAATYMESSAPYSTGGITTRNNTSRNSGGSLRGSGGTRGSATQYSAANVTSNT